MMNVYADRANKESTLSTVNSMYSSASRSGLHLQDNRPITQLREKVNINDDESLEKEADEMGQKAMTIQPRSIAPVFDFPVQTNTIQRAIGAGKKPGSRVINNNTRIVYTITVADDSKYTIEPVNLENHRVVIDVDDENYDLFQDISEVNRPQDEKSSVSSFFGGLANKIMGKETAGVSDAYRKARVKEIEAQWPQLKEKTNDVTARASSVISSESSQSHGDSTFYTAAGLGSYTLHQIIKTIYEAYHDVRVKDFEFLRAPGNEVRPDTLKGPKDFLATRKTEGWRDHDERPSLLSTNLALMANVQDSSESTFSIIESGGLFDIDVKKTMEIIDKMLTYLRMPSGFTREILENVKLLAETMDKRKNDQSAKKESVVYQIFIPRNLIQKLVYIAAKNGHPLDSTVSFVNPILVLEGLVMAGKELKNESMSAWGMEVLSKFEKMDPEQKAILMRGEKFTLYTLEAAKTITFWTKLTGKSDPQARILMDPAVFEQPSGMTRIIAHKNYSAETGATLNKGLARIKALTTQRKALLDIYEMITHYGILRAKNISIHDISTWPAVKLKTLKSQLYNEVFDVEAHIQKYVWDVIGESPYLKQQIEKGFSVTVQGKQVNMDLDSPLRMSPGELEELIKKLALQKNGPQKIPDLI